ncbi:hypothetical protein KAI78_06260 [bacterium]|nr:hypothetical protein [bacterium]
MKRMILSCAVILCVFASAGDLGYSEMFTPVDGLTLALPGGITSDRPLAYLSFNCASAARIKDQFSLRFSYFPGVFSGRAHNQTSLAMTIGEDNFAFVSYQMIANPDYIAVDEFGEILDENASLTGDSIIRAGYVRKIMPALTAGISFSLLSQTLPETGDIAEEKFSYAYLSMGMEYALDILKVGLSLNDIIAISSGDDSMTPGRLGLSVGKDFLDGTLKINAAGTYFLGPADSPMKFGLGAEYIINNIISLRAAYQLDRNELASGLSAGIGVMYANYQVDYTFAMGDLTGFHFISAGLDFSMPERKYVSKPKKEKKRSFAEEVPKKMISIAIMEFEAPEVPESYSDVIEDMISDELLDTGKYTVIERSALKVIMDEVEFQKTGCVSAECAVEVGKILAVNKMVIGKISLINNMYYIRAKIVDVETSRIETSGTIKLKKNASPEVKGLIKELLK